MGTDWSLLPVDMMWWTRWARDLMGAMFATVSVKDYRSTRIFEIRDTSYMPPFRIENLTPYNVKLLQSGTREDMSDFLLPYQTIPFGWTYPRSEKSVRISLNQHSGEVRLASMIIDTVL